MARLLPLAVLVALLVAAPAHAAIPVEVDNGGGSTAFVLPNSYGCDESGQCDQFQVRVTTDPGAGTLWYEAGTTDQASDIFGDGTFSYLWSCKHPGILYWSASQQGQVTDTAAGSFRVPACKADLWRYVSYGTAARTAGDFPPSDESVDAIKCAMGHPRHRASAAVWLCGVTSNNVYRVCNRYVGFQFFRRATGRGWGPYAQRLHWWTWKRTQCWAL